MLGSSLHTQLEHRWHQSSPSRQRQTRRSQSTPQDPGEQKVTGVHGPGHAFQLEVDGGADEFAELQFLKHGRDG